MRRRSPCPGGDDAHDEISSRKLNVVTRARRVLLRIGTTILLVFGELLAQQSPESRCLTGRQRPTDPRVAVSYVGVAESAERQAHAVGDGKPPDDGSRLDATSMSCTGQSSRTIGLSGETGPKPRATTAPSLYRLWIAEKS